MKTDNSLYIVGIGASAGGLEAISQLISGLNPNSPCAYVVLQHLSPSHRSMMVEILGRETRLQVREASQGDAPEAGVIYVVPSNFNALLRDGRLHLVTAPPEVVPKPSINQFFISLAAEENESAIGIVLSGTGSDGVAGLRSIQAAGGFTLVQSPETAKYDGMPLSAIEAGVADHVLPPEAMPAKLQDLLAIPQQVEASIDSDQIAPLLDQLREKLKFDFSGYKIGTLMRRIHRRRVATGNADLTDYLEWLKSTPQELDLLARDILISVTAFFRDREAFEALKLAVKTICSQHNPGSEIRCWVAGCASGEEAYSIAMLFAETLGERLKEYRLQIFATDVDEDALNVGRRGLYPAAAMSEVPPELLERYFLPVHNNHEADKRLRDLIVFARHNLVSDPPFLRLDLVSCRNVLIYFDAPLQTKVLQTFHFGLVKEGFLFLGRSESTTHAESLFNPLDRRERLFRKSSDLGHPPLLLGTPTRSPAQRRESKLELLLNSLVQHFGATAVLCDGQGNIQHSVGEVERFLQFPAGASRLTLTDLVVEPLRAELMTLLHRRQQQGKAQRGRPRKLARKWVRVFVEPISDGGANLSLVVFVGEKPAKQAAAQDDAPPVGVSQELEHELQSTREHLQTMVEEMATSNEEMQALNEEAQASNEELQATNEELEAANEELQASNQELVTLNGELNAKTSEMFRLNEEYSHLYDALEFPILVFDRACRLIRFNAPAERRFDLRPTALHKAASSLRLPARLADLETVLEGVLAHGDRLTQSVQLDGRIHHLSVVPGLDKTGSVVNLVVTLVDVSEIARAQDRLAESQAKLSVLMEKTTVIFAMKDISGAYVFANRRFLEFFDLPKEGYLSKTDFALLPQALAADLWALDLAALREGRMTQGEHQFTQGKHRRHLRSSHQLMLDAKGQPSGFIMEAEDISLKKLAEEQMRITARVFDQTGEAILVTDAKGHIQTVNQAFSRITGYSLDEAIGQNTNLLKSGRHSEEFYRVLWSKLEETGNWQGEIWNKRKNGEVYPEWLTINRVEDAHGQLEHYVAVFSDISSIKNAQRKAEYLSTHDTLTGMPNRSLFQDRLRQALAQARRTKQRLALLFIDLDNFKTINDTLGHDVGDELLKQAAERLRETVRDVDTAARLGGDEFTAILTDCDEESASQVAGRIVDELAASFNIHQHRLFVSASIGVAFYPEDGRDSAGLLKAADAAMYRAKELGRNRVVFFREDFHVRLLKRAAMESALRLAVKEGRLRLVFQPKYGTDKDFPLVGAEALLRWHDPDLGHVSPAEFIPLAENSGLILEIAGQVENLLFDQINLWRDIGLQVPPLALNVSPHSIRELGFAQNLLDKMQARKIEARQLRLEITENALLDFNETVKDNFDLLAEAGLRFSIDDFGTGYSSLSYLKRLPIRELKIDKSFVDGLGEDKEDEAIAKTIISFAKALELALVAEGVETETQLTWLIGQGCDMVQGYYFSRPLESADFEEKITDWRPAK
ncbi:EAL domain-containing protein [Magnetovirga frankeli]|uniref:EAL domain-containing protein n=1 Tax=Magnetovirga frankeli TaxID=947516 RepID=UPI001AFCA064|nr:EAL domain-containing protein [gamma proteobacterium SS-5]